MRQIIFTFSLAIFLGAAYLDTLANVIVEPIGIAVAPEAGDEVVEHITIINHHNEAVNFTLQMQSRDLGIRNLAPQRDLRGGPDRLEYVWRDDQENDGPIYQWIEIRNRQGVVDIPNLVDDAYYGMFDLGFVFPYYGREYRQIGVHSNGFASFIPAREIVFYWPDWQAFPNANPGDADRTPPPTCLAVNYQDLNPAIHGHIYYWTDQYMAVVTWFEIPHFSDQQDPLFWTFQLILNADGLIKYQYAQLGRYDNQTMTIGLQNEERNLGFTVVQHNFQYLREGRCIAFGQPSAWINWVRLEPQGGRIEAGDEAIIDVVFRTEDLDEGYYWANVVLTTNAGDNIVFPLIMSLGVPIGTVSGRMVDAANNHPIEGGVVSLEPLQLKVYTDANGQFEFHNIPPRNYTIVGTYDDYFASQAEIEVSAGEDTEVDFALVHAECNPNPDNIAAQVAPDNSLHLDLTITNDGNAPLNYRISRRLPEVNVNPWELRNSFNIGQILNDDRIEGVAFAQDSFYVAGAAGQEPNTIYVLNREGELIRRFIQPGESQYGMKDLEWDGEWLWGSGERRIFGFTPDGQIQSQFEGPYNPNTALAWDSDNEILWIGATTNNLAAYDRNGNRLGPVLNRRGLRISGLAYWSDDPDGYPIYILHNIEQGLCAVTKMNQQGDTLGVLTIQIPNGSSGGAYITNKYDIYSWVFMLTANIPRNDGNDRINIYQLASNLEWFSIEPTEGEIEARGAQEFDVTLDATGLPEERFHGQFVIDHNGWGKQTIIPITLDVVMGPFRTIRTIQLNRGWNLVSINLQPDIEDIPELTRPLVESGQLLFMKDGFGRFFSPARNFNNIPGWSVSQGYLMKVRSDCSLDLQGITVMADDPIQLSEGWNMVAYYPRFPTPAEVALSGIEEHLIIAKDGYGGFYLPQYNFNNMSIMREGCGYKIKVDQDVELIYQIMRDNRLYTSENKPELVHWSPCIPTGQNMSVLILAEGLNKGEIAAYANGHIVAVSPITMGRCGLTIWGDDPTTEFIDGANTGDKINLVLWDGYKETNIDYNITYNSSLSSELTYITDDFKVIKLDIEGYVPSEFALETYPNPFNSLFTIKFALPEAGEVKIQLLDLLGRQVLPPVSKKYAAGNHHFEINAANLGSGIYCLKVNYSEGNYFKKIILIK